MKRAQSFLLLPLSIALLLVGGSLSCAPKQVMKPDYVRAAANQTEPRIVIIRTSDNPLYNGPIKNFVDATPGEVSVFTFKAGNEATLERSVRKIDPGLVFTLGAQATAFARTNLPSVPLVFAMVVNYRRLKMGDSVAGVALEPTPTNEFSQFKMIMPGMKRVLAFHSDASKDLVPRVREELKTLGIDLQTIAVKKADDVMKAFPKSLAGIDVIWQMNDPVLVTEKVFNFLRDRSNALGVPFVTSLSEEFAQAGAMAAVSVDFTSLGAQSATIAREILAGKAAKQVGVQAPIGAYLALNLDVAEKIKREPDAAALANVNKVFSTASKQAAKEQAAAALAAKKVAVVDDKAVEEARRKEEEARKLETARQEEEAKKLAEVRKQEQEEERKKEEALKVEEAALKKLKKDEQRKKKEELEKKRAELLKQKDEQRKKEELRKKEEADRLALQQKQPPTATPAAKPTGGLVVFYDPDANHEAILQISSWFTKFLQAIDPNLKLQPVRSIAAYEQLQKKGQVSFAILPSSYVRGQLKRGTIVPLLLPSAKGSVDYQKVMFAKSKDAKPKTLAVTSGGASTKELTAALKAAGIPVDGVTVIPVSKDVDALLALVFGQVDAAVVKLESLEVVKTIQPQAAASLQRLQETRPITRPPFVALNGVSAEDQAKVVAAMKAMNKNPSGARAMRSLGVDAWVNFDASMLR